MIEGYQPTDATLKSPCDPERIATDYPDDAIRISIHLVNGQVISFVGKSRLLHTQTGWLVYKNYDRKTRLRFPKSQIAYIEEKELN